MTKKLLLGLVVLVMANASAFASDYGCRALLCVASPTKAPAECTETLNRLYWELSHGKPFPSCAEAEDSTGVKLGKNYWEDCPTGSTLVVTTTRGESEHTYYGKDAESAGGSWGSGHAQYGQCIDYTRPTVHQGYRQIETEQRWASSLGDEYTYTTYPTTTVKRRPKSRYVEVSIDGQYYNRAYY